MANKIINFIDATLNTRITPLAYLVALHSFVLGVAFVFFGHAESVQATLLYQNGALIGIPVWGVLTRAGAGILILGMALKLAGMVSVGSIAVFMAWVFATITYAQNENWLQMLLAIVLVLCFGYHFLANSLGRLWDYSP